jgi:hypothetical protein
MNGLTVVVQWCWCRIWSAGLAVGDSNPGRLRNLVFLSGRRLDSNNLPLVYNLTYIDYAYSTSMHQCMLCWPFFFMDIVPSLPLPAADAAATTRHV